MEIDAIAKLARLELTADEKQKFSSQLENILSYFKIIDKANVENIEPLIHGAQFETIYRKDVPRQSIETKTLLRNAPEHNDEAFLVSKVLD